jgi:hypothetical protein
MKSINQIVDLHDEIDLRMKVAVDDEVIIDRPGDSIVGNFIRMLWHHASLPNPERAGIVDRSRILAHEGDWFSQDATISQLNPLVIDIDGGSGNNPNEIDLTAYDHVTNVWSPVPELNGWFWVEHSGDGDSNNIYNAEFYEITIDPITGDKTKDAAVDFSAVDTSAWDGRIFFREWRREGVYAERDVFNNPKIVLGVDPDGNPVAIEDRWVRGDLSGVLDQTGTSVSTPAVSSFASEIELSRTFTNNGSTDITVKEVGVGAGHQYSNRQTLIARETTNFTLQASKTVTVTYLFKIANDAGGGLMAQFNELLYRHFRDERREARDIDNNKQNYPSSQWTWRMTAPGGDATFGGYNPTGPRGFEIGPVVGTGTEEVSNTNAGLSARVPHGIGDGELFYYGAAVEDFYIESSNNKAYFDVSRVFENRGSTSIDISEVGVYAGTSNDNNDRIDFSHLIARHNLGSVNTIAAGDAFKLTYRIQATV